MPTGSSPARLLWRPPGKGSFRERMKHSIRSWRFIIYPFLFAANGHGIFPVAVGDFLEKAAHPRRSIVGARHASPAWLQCLSGKFDAKARRDREKLSPGGCASRSESKIYMTASGSHTSTMVVRLKPDRMRSKVAILCHPMVIIFSFDLISRN